jgi:hypothetical protein
MNMKLLSTGLLAGILVFSGHLLELQMGSVHAASTFIGTTILEVGSDGRQVTIRTTQGESWSLNVADPELLKGVKKGDQVSLELDAQDRVSKIVKTVPGETEGSRATPSTKEQTRGDGY